MSRKPITEYVGGKGPRQRIWEAIRQLAASGAESYDEQAIWRAIPREFRGDIEVATVRDYRHCLVAGGVLAVVTEAANRRMATTYRLAADEGLEAPRLRRDGSRVTQGLAQEQMWRTLRLLSGDTCGRELAAHASTTTIPVSEVAAQHYLLALNQAGYLLCTKEGRGLGTKGSGIQARYRLKPSRNTGPRPPMICRTKAVYDPNEDLVVWAARVTDEDAIYGK